LLNLARDPGDAGGVAHAVQGVLLESGGLHFIGAELGIQLSVGGLQLADDAHEGHDFVKRDDGADHSCGGTRGYDGYRGGGGGGTSSDLRLQPGQGLRVALQLGRNAPGQAAVAVGDRVRDDGVGVGVVVVAEQRLQKLVAGDHISVGTQRQHRNAIGGLLGEKGGRDEAHGCHRSNGQHCSP